MYRTSIALPSILHQRLMLTAKAEGKHMVEMMREILDEGLSQREKNTIDKSYLALEKMIGVNKEPVTDAASTINQTLYGEPAAMKGAHA